MKVVASMSAGVDFSVAAARLVDQGYDVVGIHVAEFLEPLTGLTPGQTIALYDNTRVIGSGTVVTTTRS